MKAFQVIARASFVILRRHVIRSLGGVRTATAVMVGVVVLAAATNVLVLQFYKAHLGGAFPSDPSGAPILVTARHALVASQVMIAAVVGLGILMVTPPASRLRPSARAAGASSSAMMIGETVPFMSAIFIVVGLGGAGPTWFVASRSESPGVAFVALSTTAVAVAALAVAVHAVIVTLFRAASVSPVLARIIALLVAFGTVGTLLADLLRATTQSAEGMIARGLASVWGADDSLGLRALAGGAVFLVASVLLLAGARLLERDDGVFPRTPRILSLRSVGRPASLVNAIPRETLLLMRHPVGQATTTASGVLAVLLVVAAGQGLVPNGAVLSACAMLFAANAETSYGRSASWRWVRQLSGTTPSRTVIEQYLGVLPIGGFLVAASAVATVWTEPGAILSTLLLYASMSSLAYLAGVLLPFDDGVPTAIVATSLIAVSLEAAALWVMSWVAAPGTVVATCLDLLVIPGALLLATAAVRRKG